MVSQLAVAGGVEDEELGLVSRGGIVVGAEAVLEGCEAIDPGVEAIVARGCVRRWVDRSSTATRVPGTVLWYHA